MESLSIYSFVAIGTGLMLFVTMPSGKHYGQAWWKTALATICLAMIGLAGAVLMFRIESGSWGGRSFFGALFLPPLAMIPIGLLLRYPYRKLIDICAPGECIMLALLKSKCYADGCCYGRVIRFDAHQGIVRFPSQLVELGTALILAVILMIVLFRMKREGYIYPIYMVLYGVFRFVLNLFRETEPFFMGLPAGNMWSIVSFVLGLVWIIVLYFGIYQKDIRLSPAEK